MQDKMGVVKNPTGKTTTNKHRRKRSDHQIEYDLVDEARLLLHGWTHQEIADWLAANRPYKLDRSQVSKDLKKVHERWQESYLSDMDKMKSRELARIDTLERSYWDAFDRSMKDKEKTESNLVEDEFTGKGGASNQGYKRKQARKTVEKRDGDAVFLKGIQWCITQRCKILGLDAPKKVEVDWRQQAEEMGYNPGEMFNEMVRGFLQSDAGDASLDESDDGGGAAGS